MISFFVLTKRILATTITKDVRRWHGIVGRGQHIFYLPVVSSLASTLTLLTPDMVVALVPLVGRRQRDVVVFFAIIRREVLVMLRVVFGSFVGCPVCFVHGGSARNTWGRLYETCPLLKPRRSPTPAPPQRIVFVCIMSIHCRGPTHVPPQIFSSPKIPVGCVPY